MNSEGRFWITLWSIIFASLTIIIALNLLSHYLTEREEVAFMEKGLQPYTVSECSALSTRTEWHNADWVKPTSKGYTHD